MSDTSETSGDGGTDYPILPGLDEGAARRMGFVGALNRLVDAHTQDIGAAPSDEAVNAMARIASAEHGAAAREVVDASPPPSSNNQGNSSPPSNDGQKPPEDGGSAPFGAARRYTMRLLRTPNHAGPGSESIPWGSHHSEKPRW